MEQLPALSTVLCTVLLIPTWGAGLRVLQSPIVRAHVGETATLGCSFTNRQGSVANVKWTRAPGVVLDSHHPFYSGRLNVSFWDLLRKGEVTLTLSELEKRDSGHYHCHVSIRQGESWTGAGTELQVMERNQTDTGLTVLQSPAVLRASPGETVNLSCSFENRQGSVVKATWTRAPGVVLESDHPFYSGRLNVSFRDLLRKGEATLTLSELEKRDSGLYQCQISIHQGERGTGAGTELQVTGRNQSDTGLTVLQSPAVLRASPGETVNLSCSFENRQGSVAKATWTRAPGVVLESHHPFYKGRLNVSDLNLLRKGEATLTLSELEKRDSGLYQCQISIHQGESGTGAGTELQVMGRNQSDIGKEPAPVGCCARELLYQVAIALGLLLILGLAATLLLKRHRALPPVQPRQRQPKGHGSRGAEESESLHYAEIKFQSRGRREHTSNHAQRR
ncbi:tyrosine-protein phosphatase non-receptor type substrate 1-like isoform X3 [Chelonia mydas]|uniref:tyrosine-protein phosphatase non-receptor type substrate 1-like isoform X3 n=1 Tax=Chelonia mydas TaxID=8469 RepID=UPI001CA7D15D|nr:tyrosine-protein phosphatase non-receptor type substrate 1-like isoform X3 [Chelonia mydas]